MVAYAGLNPRHHRSGSSIDRPTRISKIGNATLRSSLYMPALSAMRCNPAVAALVARLKSAGRLKPKQIVVAAMRKLLVLCFGVLKTGKRFAPTIAMPASAYANSLFRCSIGSRSFRRPDLSPCRPARAAEVKQGRRPARDGAPCP
jgi:transposase